MNNQWTKKCYAWSPNAQDMFHSIPAISCTGAARKWGLVSHADFVDFSFVRFIELFMYVLCTGDHSVEREAWSYWCWCQSGDVWRRSRDSRIGRWSVCELHNGPGYKLVVLATHSDDCVVLTGRFRHSLVTSVAFLLCVWHVMFKESLQFEQNVVEMLPSFVKLVISFQKAYKSVFLVRFVVLTYLEFLGCMLVVETPGM